MRNGPNENIEPYALAPDPHDVYSLSPEREVPRSPSSKKKSRKEKEKEKKPVSKNKNEKKNASKNTNSRDYFDRNKKHTEIVHVEKGTPPDVQHQLLLQKHQMELAHKDAQIAALMNNQNQNPAAAQPAGKESLGKRALKTVGKGAGWMLVGSALSTETGRMVAGKTFGTAINLGSWALKGLGHGGHWAGNAIGGHAGPAA